MEEIIIKTTLVKVNQNIIVEDVGFVRGAPRKSAFCSDIFSKPSLFFHILSQKTNCFLTERGVCSGYPLLPVHNNIDKIFERNIHES
jgi:hypothetical protein